VTVEIQRVRVEDAATLESIIKLGTRNARFLGFMPKGGYCDRAKKVAVGAKLSQGEPQVVDSCAAADDEFTAVPVGHGETASGVGGNRERGTVRGDVHGRANYGRRPVP
jgi:hypothetical protein